jgi:autotransporter-associated beta strand protein
MAQNAIGDADLSMTDGTLSLRGSSTGTILSLPNHLTLAGTVTVDPERNVSGSGNVVFRFASITLKPGTVMGVSGDNSFAIGSLAPVVMQGNATLQGFNSGTTADGVTNFYGGISGGPTSALTIGNTSRPINLTIGAAGTYGGGTVMNGGNVTLNTASGFGIGTTALNGGSLTLNAEAALNGTVTLNGGTLVVNGANILASNPIVLAGGTLDLRTNTSTSAVFPSLTVSGTSAMNFTRVSSSGSALLTVPLIDVAGETALTVTNASNVTNLYSGFDLAGDLTLTTSSATRVISITEDGSPRKLIKTGTAQLDLEGASSHSGGTEVLAGVLYVENGAGLGSGPLTIGATSGTAAATVRFAEGFTIPNDIVVRSGSSGTMMIDAETGILTWNGNVDLQKSVTLDNGGTAAADTSYFNGLISGAGDITKVSGGEITLANAANSFGSGTSTSVSVSAGNLTVASDGALGNPANGVNLTSSGALKVNGTFATSRTITFTGTAADVNVTAGNTLTLNSPVAGTGTFWKGDAGTLEIAASVDATARGSAITAAAGGILRVQGLKNLGDASPIAVDGGTFEFVRDPDTNFAHPLSIQGNSGIRVDRAIGGSGTNGRHSLGMLTVANTTSGHSLTVSGANGYGLSATGYTTPANSSLTNNAPGTLILGTLTGNPGTASRTLTIGGSGDIEITGATSEAAGTGTYGIVKTGAGKITFGSSLADFDRVLTVNDGTLDLNGNAYSSAQVVTMGGVASALGARIETGAIGSLNLGAGLTFGSGSNPAGALITGNVGLGALSQTFTINNSSAADPDLTIDGPITGSPGAALVKSGSGTLRLSGAGNTQPGLVSASNGILELAKTSGDAIGIGGLDINPTTSNTTVKLLAADQIHNSAPVNLSGASEVFLDLNNFTETVGPLSLAQTDVNDYTAVRTGATGTLVLNGNLTFNNNINSSSNEERNVLITGTGSEFTPAFDGFLDLGGVTRTIHVATTTVGANEPRANATIETRILNGGILKTGPRTLFLTNPNNTFAGGLQIAGGTVRSGGGNSLGLGPVTFTNALGVAAGIDFGTSIGPIADNFTLTGAGDATFTYSGLAPNTLTLSGDFTTTQNLIFDVVNGSTADGDSATLDLTGTINDAAATINLTKIGNGTLKLASGNTFTGATTVQKGILSISAESALGDGTAALVIDGGCFSPTASIALGRNLVFGTIGGSVRGGIGLSLDLPAVGWGAGASAFFGPGTTILSGTTTGSGGDLSLGVPTAFATPSSSLLVGSGHVLSLSGTSSLPAGNLSFENRAVLELGSGNFTRALGTGPGEVQFATATGGGWAAHGADRSVNLGGAGATVVWGQTSPAFLFKSVPGNDYGALVLGSSTGTHTVDFQNLIELNNGASSVFRDLVVNNGPAAVDARISGGISQSADPNITFTSLDLEVAGTLDISGPMSGEIGLDKLGTGTVILSGTNTFFGDRSINEGTLQIAGDASWGNPDYVYVETGATLDASAMTSHIIIAADDGISIYGTLLGDLTTPGYLEGNGLVDGNVQAQAGAYVFPDYNGLFHITGDFTLDATAFIDFYLGGLVPQTEHNVMRVGGTVNLSGRIFLGADFSVVENDSAVLILNDGSDPIIGTFAGLPEGAGIPIGNGLALQVTYQANGDGGAVGNDFGVTVVIDTFSTDLALSVNAPLAVDFGSSFAINYTVENFGPTDSTGSTLDIPLPPNAVLVGSVPAGTVNGGTLTIPVPALAVSATTTVTVQFTAPMTEAAILVEPLLTANGIDGFPFDNEAPSVTAVMAGGCLQLSIFERDELNNDLILGIDTIPGVSYVLEQSIGLDDWSGYFFFEGDGEIQEFTLPMNEEREFFRFNILPYSGGGIGEENPE